MGALVTSEERLTVQGIPLEVIRKGSGRPLLILHGGGGIEATAPYLDQLAEQVEVIAPSHPGFGRSPLPDRFESIADLAYLYLDLLRTLDRPDAILMGYSMGGWVAAEIAVRCTHHFSQLILVDPVGIKVGDRETRDIPDIFAMPFEQLQGLLYSDQSRPPLDLQALSDEELTIYFRNREALALYAWEPYMHHPSLRERLHRVDRPTLVIWGEGDGLVSRAYVEAYQAAIPGAQLAVIPQAGHRPYLEQPEIFVEHVRTFLRQTGK